MGPVTEQVAEGNDLHGGHGQVREGDRARVGVSHVMVEKQAVES